MLSIPVPATIQGDESVLKFVTDLSASITSALHDSFGATYEVSADDATMSGSDWDQRLTIRRGTRVGAEVVLKWSKLTSRAVKLDVQQNPCSVRCWDGSTRMRTNAS